MIEGTLADSTVLSTSGSLPAASTFITIPSPDSSQVFDLLRLEIIPNSAASFNVDNIVVTTVGVSLLCDFSGDSACDLADIDDLGDYTRLASSFSPLGYTEAAAVPEPNFLVLFSLGGVLALLRRRTAR